MNLLPGPAPERAEIGAMVRVLHHRGPDDTGLYLDERAALGHARLSIIDLSSGRQPIHNEDETVLCVFNGEIFNYVELRRSLVARGHRFYTQSDTEVIVHLYEDHGPAFVDHLNGQFAVALWDRRLRRLLLARDRVGIRPLFYTILPGGRLLFASEVKALFICPGVERRFDLRALGESFTYWAPLPPRTIFSGVSSLPPGHLMVVEPGDTQPVPRRYWDWRFPAAGELDRDPRSLDQCAEQLRALLQDAVRLQLRADVPVGAYLSGGLDSAVIASLVKQADGPALRTFSISFTDAEFDEAPYQRQMSDRLRTRHTTIRCGAEDICAAFPRALWHTESILLRTAPVPLLLLAAEVRRQGHKVVLTGEGADEVLCGYDLFKEAQVRRFWARRPQSPLRPLLLSRLYPYLAASPVRALAYARSFFGQGLSRSDAPCFGHLPRWQTTQRTHRLFSAELHAELRGFAAEEAIAPLLPADFGRLAPLCRDQYIEALTLLSGYLLCSQGDRVAMAHSIEGRFPFLDHRVIELCNGMPTRYKLMGLREKLVLRRAVADLLPPAVCRRPKQPYRAPDSRSFFRDGRPADYVAELLGPDRIRQAGYFDPEATSLLMAKCQRGEAIGFADNMALVGILSTMLLDQMMLRDPRTERHE